MNRRPAVPGFLLLLLAALPGSAQQHGRPPEALVRQLDAAIQSRIQHVDGGVIRGTEVADAPRHPELRHLSLRSPEERSAAAAVRAAHWDAVFLVSPRSYEWVGRAYRDGAPPPGFEFWKVISPPAALTGRKPRALLPDQQALVTRVADAFQAFRTRPSYEFRVGEWYVVARPVRARQAACVSCHHKDAGDPLRRGEALAVAMYAFAPAHP